MIRTSRRLLVLVVLIILFLLGVSYLALSQGTPTLSPQGLWQVLGGGGDLLSHVVVLQLRLPRLVLGLLAGASLAVVGVILQDTLRNALAGPELLGVSAGAVVVMAAVTIYSLPVPFELYPILAMAGSLLSGGTVLGIARQARTPVQVALIGAAVSALLDAFMIGLIALGSQAQVEQLYQFLLGSLANRTWDYVRVLLPWAALGIPLALLSAGLLNVLRLGDEMAEGLGLRVLRLRMLLLLLSCAMVAAVVATCGPIGFVALLAPHLARRLLGSADARLVLPLAALLGAALLTAADLPAHLAFAPQELPVGLWTTLIGGPLMLVLLRGTLRPAQRVS